MIIVSPSTSHSLHSMPACAGTIYNRILRTRASARVLIFYPIYKPVNHSEDYARVKLHWHHSFREIEDLKVVDDLTFPDFAGGCEFCKNAHNHPSDAYGEDIPEPEPDVEDDPQPEEPELPNSWTSNELLHRIGADHLEQHDTFTCRLTAAPAEQIHSLFRNLEVKDFILVHKANLKPGMKPHSVKSQRLYSSMHEWWMRKLIKEGIEGVIYESTLAANGSLSRWNARVVLVLKEVDGSLNDEPRLLECARLFVKSELQE
ncbi:hypothetical protein GX51_04907 [Blastomyces parvus]|uniref:Uncharacterized protein n=1 Tax=Blastomyces parvus TaxID=2060905 RepID=A0A2B7WZ67_9EURO|nr:hypothetical protein GX51_04907 [Blastomyces parvus]